MRIRLICNDEVRILLHLGMFYFAFLSCAVGATFKIMLRFSDLLDFVDMLCSVGR